MTVGELHELDEVKMLVARGQEAGLLTFGQIATALTEIELEEGDIEEIHLVLERAEIELVEDDHPFAQASRQNASPCMFRCVANRSGGSNRRSRPSSALRWRSSSPVVSKPPACSTSNT